MTPTKAHGQKDALDKFYTKADVVDRCLQLLDLGRFATVIEPSAGAGAFVSRLVAAGVAPLAFDIAPEADGIVRQDWFAFSERPAGPTLVVGNPPYGQQCSLAVRFINHAFETVGADTVAFVLPRSFRKASVQSRVFANARLAAELVLPADSFTLHGASYSLNAVFQVWERDSRPRADRRGALTSPLFSFTRRDQPHDFAVRRVGGRAGRAFTETAGVSEQSNYFIKLAAGLPVAAVVELVNSLRFDCADDGTGPRSLSKRELVAMLDERLSAASPAS